MLDHSVYLLQMPSDAYWAAVGTSNGLNFAWWAVNWIPRLSTGELFLGVSLDCLFHNPQDLFRNSKLLLLLPTSAEMVRFERPCLCSSQSDQFRIEKYILPLPSGGYDIVNTWQKKWHWIQSITINCLPILFFPHSHFFLLHFEALLKTFLRSKGVKCKLCNFSTGLKFFDQVWTNLNWHKVFLYNHQPALLCSLRSWWVIGICTWCRSLKVC